MLLESGVTWLPPMMWRFGKDWRGIRTEVPWVQEVPAELIRRHVRLTMQPFDAPPDPADVGRAIDQMGSDEMLLFATDYPHWQFDGDQAFAGRAAGIARAQDHDRQSARDIFPSRRYAAGDGGSGGGHSMSVTTLERQVTQPAKLTVVDCDIHPTPKSPTEVASYLPRRWRDHLAAYGTRVPGTPYASAVPYPRMWPGNGGRLDAYPPGGGLPASDLEFMRSHHLDQNGVEFGILQPLPPACSALDQDLGAALCRAVNEWQLERWAGPEKRLKASICAPQDDPDAAIAEIERLAGDPHFVQIAISPRSIEPLGRKRYRKLLECAAAHDLPIGIHSSAFGHHVNSGSGWYGYYFEEHYAFANNMQSIVTSLIMEGTFEAIPNLKLVLVEGGFAWAAPFMWRLDTHWARMRSEVPHVKRPPSEYVRENVWLTTQPMEEPERPRDLIDTIRWIGADRLMFSTDYPHWDFDDPKTAFKVKLPQEHQNAIYRDNAKALFKLM